MSPLNKKNRILNSISQMDTRMLSVLLDDAKTYDYAEKEVFIAKLDTLFQQFKKLGDNQLVVHGGKCVSGNCKHAGCTGYAFEGEQSGLYMAFTIKEGNNDVTDIFQCAVFEPTSELTAQQRTYYIQEDERADFTPPRNYWIKRHQCEQALDELYAYKNQVLNKDIYLPWLNKYKALYESTSGIENRYAAYDTFHSLYFSIQELEELLEFSDQAEQALEEFSKLQHEEEVLFWLSKYEELGHQLMFFTSLRCETESEDVILPFSMDQFNIDPIDFLYLFRFNFLFDNNYYPMLDKYITYDVEELKDYLNVDDGHFHPQVTSLTYHLKRRGILPL